MKLLGHPQSPCTRKILLLAREKGAPLELVTIDLFAGAHRTPAFRELHPFGRVPVLEDGDFRLYESRPILRYLDACWSGPALTPSDPRERARMEQWLSVDHSYVAPHTRTLAIENVLRAREGHAPDAAAVQSARAELASTFRVLEEALALRSYLAGPLLSLADLSLLPYLASLAHFGAEDVLAGSPRLFEYRGRLLERPGYRDVLGTGE